ncbi:MAG: flagellar basal-body rod protein FlgG [Phycisphaerales bacterium]|nr:flagellar basal-body rod protein FlgG [Phycisphaerales bacterium]
MAINALNASATGLSALSTQLDVIANNLANVNTDGFKASRANFQDLLYIEKQQPGVRNANGDERPTGLYIGLGVKTSGTQQDFAQGAARQTGRQLDVMIEGDGFFVVTVEDSLAGGGVAYTRAGNFAVNSDGQMVMTNTEGRILDPVIEIPDDAETIGININGLVTVRLPGQVDPQEVGRIELAKFINPAGLKQIGENLWAESPASGSATVGEPNTDGRGRVHQNMLEASNVDPTIELMNLIRTQRAFELNAQAIKAADDTLQQVSNLKRF